MKHSDMLTKVAKLNELADSVEAEYLRWSKVGIFVSKTWVPYRSVWTPPHPHWRNLWRTPCIPDRWTQVLSRIRRRSQVFWRRHFQNMCKHVMVLHDLSADLLGANGSSVLPGRGSLGHRPQDCHGECGCGHCDRKRLQAVVLMEFIT